MTEATEKEVTKMSKVLAVKKYLEKDSEIGIVPTSEMAEFWKSCSREDKADFARVAAKELGVELRH